MTALPTQCTCAVPPADAERHSPLAAPAAAPSPRPSDDAPSVAPTVASLPARGDPASLKGVAIGAPHNPHFARIGGTEAIARLVERFYVHMDARADAQVVRAMHPADLGPVKAVLVRYLTEWTGGPQVYSAERGKPRLRRKHLPFAIGAPEREAWLACMTQALADTVDDDQLRRELLDAFSRTADFIRNDQESTHDHHRNDTPRAS